MWVFLILLAAKAFGFAHYSWMIVFLPLIAEVVFDILILAVFGRAIFRWVERRPSRRSRL